MCYSREYFYIRIEIFPFQHLFINSLSETGYQQEISYKFKDNNSTVDIKSQFLTTILLEQC